MWSIFEAIEGRVSDRFSPEAQMGLLAAPLLIRSGESMRLSDIDLLVVPGLAALGIVASIDTVDTLDALATNIKRFETPHPFFTLNSMPILTQPLAEASEPPDLSTASDPIVVDVGAVKRQVDCEPVPLFFKRSPTRGWVRQPPDIERRVWALVTMKRSLRSGFRNANITACLLRWIAFAAANPDRLIGSVSPDQTERAAAFISECAGSQSSPASTRLRRSAAAFQSGNVNEAMAYLKQAVLLRMGLTAALRSALSRPEFDPLTSMERRELIYLARSGTAELKTLAVHRLASDANRDHPDVRATVQQLAYDGNIWVRAAAGNYNVTG